MNTNAGMTSLEIRKETGHDVRQMRIGHRDQYVQYSHQMTAGTADSSARTLTRLVPLIYGALLGGLVGSVALGMVFGLLMSAALDIRMGDKSIGRPLLRPVFRLACPFVLPLLRALGIAGSGPRLPVPAGLRDARCDGR